MAITYPTLTEQNSSRDFIEIFRGYNHNLRIGEGEFYDMKNLTSSYYPLLSTRQPRGTEENYSLAFPGFNISLFQPVGMVDNDDLNILICTSRTIYEMTQDETYKDNGYALFLSRKEKIDGEWKAKWCFVGYTDIGSGIKRNIVSMGANIIIFPDKKYLNITELENAENALNITSFNELVPISKDMEATYVSSGTVSFKLCKMDGTEYTINTTSSEEPTNVANGHIWLDTSVTPHSLKQYSDANNMWASIATTYIKISAAGIGKAFEVYDGVRISGVGSLTDLNNTMVIQAKGDDYIVVIGVLDKAEGITQDASITVKRIVPNMDFVIESNNRLWGCRYGENRNGDFVNEIYASKLGDFKNWECFQGTSTDSYVASIGTDSAFTGAISYLGYPLFFKQNCLHTIYGSYPATYQIQLTECRGVQQGCHNSLVVIDGTLYYKALGGVCAYNGSLPVDIGSALGEIGKRYYGACAGAYRHKYYIGMHDIEDDPLNTWLFVYDTEKGMWHKEDQYNGAEFCYCSSGETDQLYYIARGKVKAIIGESYMRDTEKNVDWFAETGVLGCSSPDKKYISKVSIRFAVDIGTRIRVFAEYDSSGVWEQLAVFTGSRLGAFTLPFKPRRCDHLRLKIEGNGAAKIYSISKTMEDGGEF